MQLKHDAANAPTSLDIVNFYIGVRSAACHQVAVGCVACPVAHHCEFLTWACPLSLTYYSAASSPGMLPVECAKLALMVVAIGRQYQRCED